MLCKVGIDWDYVKTQFAPLNKSSSEEYKIELEH
jgi:hypothetical protein